MPPQNTAVVQDDPPQNMLLWNVGYLELKAPKNSKCRERLSLNSLYLPNNSASKGSSTVQILSLGFSSTRGARHLPQARRLQLTPQPGALCHKLSCLSSILLKALLILPKNQSPSLKRPTCPSPFTIKMALKTKFSATSGSYSFLPGYIICTS